MRYVIACVTWQSPNEVWSIVETREYFGGKGNVLDRGDLYIKHKTGTIYYPRMTLDGWTAYSRSTLNGWTVYSNNSRKVPSYVFEAWEEMYVVPDGFPGETRVMDFRDIQAKWNVRYAIELAEKQQAREKKAAAKAAQELETLEKARHWINQLEDSVLKNTLRHYCEIMPEWYRLKYPKRTEYWAQGAVMWRAEELAAAASLLFWTEVEASERREEVD